MSGAGEIRSLLDLILMLWPISFKVYVEKGAGSTNINVRVQNSGIHIVHITDICICNQDKNVLICINSGKGSVLGWNSNFNFPKTLIRNEPCNCVINLPLTLPLMFNKPKIIYVMATDSTGKNRFSEAINVDW